MSAYRKRKSSDILEGDRKRIPLDRYDGWFIKQEHNAQSSNNGRLYAAVPYNYDSSSVAPVIASGGVQSAVVFNRPHRYYNSSQYVDQPYRSDDRNVISSNSSGCNGVVSLAYYDKGRQMNFQHEVYINSLRQSEPRYDRVHNVLCPPIRNIKNFHFNRIVNFNELRRHLSDIDIRLVYNWNFSTALDLTLELESSLNYFVDTRNELVFLRKMQRTQCIPFSYNEINITNRNGIYNRMRFLQDESFFRSNRMNQLFYQLQSVVIPAIIDDIRYVHSVSYEKAWINRARYWFNLYKQIKWEHAVDGGGDFKQQSKHRRPHRKNANINEAGVGDVDKANFTSETFVPMKVLPFDSKCNKIEEKSTNGTQVPPKYTALQPSKQDTILPPENCIQTVSHIVQYTITPVDTNNSVLLQQQVPLERKETVEIGENIGAETDTDRSNSCVIAEQDVSFVDLKEDDNNNDSGKNDNLPEEDFTINQCN